AKKFMISCFDGGFCMAFKSDISDNGSLVNGKFTGGPVWKSIWKAERDEAIHLPDAYSLVTVKNPDLPFSFSFTDLHGKRLNSEDARFKNKVIIIQVMGSWCANCKDETFLFKDFYSKYHEKGLEIVGLSFETKDSVVSKNRIDRFVKYIGINYPILYAGEASRDNRNKVLSNLEGSIAYPTTLFIDKKGKIRKVHTGFSGPATGKEYTDYVKHTTGLIEQLLNE
ncbi:MAG: TlpA disulfide reductase family protein, partial [Bacteroidia bacterium]|nr:TlpA disulfide reductase family protein [Bacteroidia bacterium]